MKKTLSSEALLKEAAYWDGMKMAAAKDPGKACLK
jgi:hypothetical protein